MWCNQGGGGMWNLHIQLQKKLRPQSSTPPNLVCSSHPPMFFLEGTIGYWQLSPLNVLYHWQWQSTMMVGSLCQWHLLPHSVVLPGSPCSSSSLTGPAPCQPPMHPMLTLSLPSGHRTQEMSLNATHIRTCTRPSSSTHSSSRLSLTAQFLSYRHYCYSMTCASYLPWPIPNSSKICKWGQNRVVYNYAKYTVITYCICPMCILTHKVILSVFFHLTLRFYRKLLTEYVCNLPNQAPRVLW